MTNPTEEEELTRRLDAGLLDINRELVTDDSLPTAERVDCLLGILRASPDPSVEALLPANLRIIRSVMENLDEFGAQASEIRDWLKGKWTIVQKAMKQMGVRKTTGDVPLRVVDPDRIARIKDVISDAPVSERHLVPSGWTLRDESTDSAACLLRVVADLSGELVRIPVARRPVVLTAWVKNLTTGAKCLGVGWKANGKWRDAVIERDRLYDTCKIIPALANFGFPIASHNRADMVRYLADYEDANLSSLPIQAIAEQMGWVGDKGKAFLCGDRLLSAPGVAKAVSFRAPDEGEQQLASALEPRGTFDGWVSAVSGLAEYPRVILGVYASLAAPLLELLQIPGCVIDWSYRTSTGKSVVLRAAASCWGNPDERSGASLVQTWNTTLVGFERIASALKNIPVILDDTKTATRPQMVADVLYQAVVGHGKTRGSVVGSRRTASWRTMILSTGERKATDFSRDAGSAARCLALWGSPFGTVSDEIAHKILDFERKAFIHHGHAGPMFVEWLLTQDRAELRDRYDAVHDRIWKQLKDDVDSAVASRAGYAIAAIEFAGMLAHEALELTWPYVSPWVEVLDSAIESLKDTDRAKEALNYVYEWACERRELFYGTRRDGTYGSPPSQWAGAWDSTGIAITGATLQAVLDGAGYEFQPTVRQWAERGWLKRGGSKTYTARAKIGDDCPRVRCYVLNARALAEVGANDSPTTEEE